MFESIAAFWAEYGNVLTDGVWDTLVMVVISTAFAYLIGLPLGVALILTQPHGIRPHRGVYRVLDWIVNIGRSVPFIILMVAIMPFTRMVVGTTIGVKGAIVPLVVSAAPFIARMVETSLNEVDAGVVEAAQSMGASTLQIVWKVYLPEAKPSLILGGAISLVTILAYTAIAGTVGAGGLGDIAARGTGVQIAADYLLLSFEHRCLQRVALTAGRGLRCHAEVHRGQEPALVGDGELLDGLAGDLDAAGYLLRLSAARGRDLRLLDVVDGRDLLSDPARGSGLDILDGVADGLLAAVLDCLEVSDELLQVAELRRDAVLRHGRRLLPIRKKRPAGVGSPVGLLPSVVIWFSSGQPLGIVTALPVCPAVFCRI